MQQFWIAQVYSYTPTARPQKHAHVPLTYSAHNTNMEHSMCRVSEQEGAPLMLNMWGINIYTGGHYDNYVVNYYGYRQGPAPPGTFNKPAICPDKPEPENALTPHHKQAGIQAQIRRMLPNRHHGDSPAQVHYKSVCSKKWQQKVTATCMDCPRGLGIEGNCKAAPCWCSHDWGELRPACGKADGAGPMGHGGLCRELGMLRSDAV